MKILYIGDVSTRRGREMLKLTLPSIRAKHNPDLIVANIENAAGGRGVTREIIREITSYGVDLTTGGDHTFGIKDFIEELSDDLAFLVPANYEADLPGRRYEIVELNEKKIMFLCLLGKHFVAGSDLVRNPFYFVDEFLESEAAREVDAFIVEVHAETATEKMSLAWYLKDRVAAVVGTHTHVATADNRVLADKIAYVTDIGQVGPYEGSLWVDFENVIHNFRSPDRRPFKVSESGPLVFNSVLITLSDDEKISPLSIARVDSVLET